jgi:hypothetical protein
MCDEFQPKCWKYFLVPFGSNGIYPSNSAFFNKMIFGKMKNKLPASRPLILKSEVLT